MLFSDIQRTDSSPLRCRESLFAHLDRRARADYDRFRALIEQWFSHVPSGAQHEIQQRFHSRDDAQFHSAFLELYTHELLLKMEHRVEIHPELACTNKRPDFMATGTDSSTTIIECAVVTEETIRQLGAQARLDEALDAIKRIHSPDYSLDVHSKGVPGTPVPLRRWCDQIKTWIETLDYDTISTLGQQQPLDQPPKRTFTHEGLDLTVTLSAKKQSACGESGVRPTTMRSSEGGFVTSRCQIRDSIKKKAKRYGNPKLPYIVVVNCIGVFAEQEEIEEAMYGPEGVWLPTPPLFTRLSGVVAIHELFPWSVPRANICLFHNPNASFPYESRLTKLPQARLVDGNIEKSHGIQPREFFNLPVGWPKDEGDS